MAAEGPSSSKAAFLRPSQPPARRGLPEGKQPPRWQISQGVLTEAACVRVGGPSADFAWRRVRERHSAPAQAAFRASPGRKQSPWAGRPWRMYLGEGYCGNIRETPASQPLTLGPGWIVGLPGAGGRGRLYLASARNIRPSHSPPRSLAQSPQNVEMCFLQGSWDWTACLPPSAFPIVEGKVVGRETHTGPGIGDGGGIGALYPRAAGMTAF